MYLLKNIYRQEILKINSALACFTIHFYNNISKKNTSIEATKIRQLIFVL